ncbi:MAG TPA: tetratricopeptide repeat protein [Anaerolineae bacterium]|nr:tetratricopeptide repeat protein [Anaerolineae bacterium]
MKIRFWGTRGSIPTPLKPYEVANKIYEAILRLPPELDTSDPKAVKSFVASLPPLLQGTAGGNTPCVEIQTGGDEIFVIDAGSGLRELGLELMKGPMGRGEGVLHLFISHPHWDHIQGFTIFPPAFVPGNKIFVYGVHDVQATFETQHNSHNWPVTLKHMRAEKTFVHLEAEQTLTLKNIQVRMLENNHPGKSYSYRIEDRFSSMVYASDVEFKDLSEAALRPYIEFYMDANALIFDAQYTLREAWFNKSDWGHSSAMIGIDLARAANVNTLLLFHHDPTYSDKELENMLEAARSYQAQKPAFAPQQVLLAQEGLTLDLARPGAVDVQVSANGAATILTPIRVIAQESMGQLAKQLAAIARSETTSPIIDLSQVETLTTANLKAIINLRQTRRNDPLVLAAAADNLVQMITLAGYRDYFAIYPTVEAALAAEQVRKALNLPGQIIKGRYRIESTVGKGPIGTVLTAYDTQENRQVALKVLSPTFSTETTGRVLRHAQQVIALSHPHIVKVYAWDQDADYTFQVEAFVPAATLQTYFTMAQVTTWSREQRIQVLQEVTLALEYAHSQGVVHGDLKPSNIYLTEQGIQIDGFGLGRLEENHNLLTAPFLFLDSHYLAPEQILGHILDARTDLYALGVIAYQLFTGQFPFDGQTDEEVLQIHLRRAPRPPREINPDISPAEEHLILKLLAKNPNHRYASAQQVRNVLSSLTTSTEDPHQQRRTPLVGHSQAHQTLQKCWETAREGHGQLVFITGEAGVGKTTLAQQVAAQSQPPVTLTGQCQEHQTGTAYQVFADILRAYFATVPPEFFNEETQKLLGNFIRLAPEIQQMLPNLPAPAPLEPEQEQFRLMSHLTQFIHSATQRRPWFIILDNLQWADRNSLELLRYLGYHLPTMALLIVGLYREDELTRKHPLVEALHHLSSHPGYLEIPLQRLNKNEVQELLQILWHMPAPALLAQTIFEHTQGNPRYVEEIAQALLDNGVLNAQQAPDTPQAITQVQLPPSMREAVRQRIERLSPSTRALLQQAAILGASFNFDTLQEMSGLSKWEALENLDQALERGLLEETPGEGALRFRHNEIQQILYTDLGTLRRQMLHRKAADALEHQAQPHPERIAEKLAYHFAQAEELGSALHYSFLVAQQAQSAYANDVAVQWYQRVLTLYPQLAAPPDSDYHDQYLKAHQALGEVLLLQGAYDEALEHSHTVWKELTTTPTTRPEQLARLCHQIARIRERRSEYRLALSWVEKGLEYLQNHQPANAATQLYNLAGWINIRQGDYGIAQSQLQLALILAQAANLRQAEANSLQNLGVVESHLGQSAQAQANFEQALRIYHETGDQYGESAVLSHLGLILESQGKYSESRACHERALRIYREIGDRRGESTLLNNLGVIARNEGNYTLAVTCGEEAMQIAQDIGDMQGNSEAHVNLGVTLRDQGAYEQAKTQFEHAILLSAGIGDRRGQANAFHHLGIIAEMFGNFTFAQTYQQQVFEIRQKLEDRAGISEALAYLGSLARQRHDLKTARQYGEQSCDIAMQTKDRARQALSQTLFGHTLQAGQLFPQALNVYQNALTLREALHQTGLALEVHSALAAIYYRQADYTTAYQHILPVLASLETPQVLYSALEMLQIYLTCYQVLEAIPDKTKGPYRAEEVLTIAYNLLVVRAAQIKDETVRRAYLESHNSHQEILAAYERRRLAAPLTPQESS